MPCFQHMDELPKGWMIKHAKEVEKAVKEMPKEEREFYEELFEDE